MTFPVLPSNSATGYNLTKSLRFRESASSYLNRTPSSAGNRQKFTLSIWYKAGNIGTTFTNANFLSAGGDGSNILLVGSGAFGATLDNRFTVRENNATAQFYWPMVFRDPSSWYHIVLAVDTTQATSSNRAKLYVNGVDQGAFSGTGYAQNDSTSFNNTTAQYIGAFNSSFYYTSCYFAEYNWIDGQQLTASSFGETSSITGVWIPKKYTGTYGTNGFYLKFTDTTSTSTLGNDFSGNSNNWTTNNFSLTAGSTYDSMTDVPTLTSATAANYATFNGIGVYTNLTSNLTYSNGNLQIAYNNDLVQIGSSIRIPNISGKFYLEFTATYSSSSNGFVGLFIPDGTVILQQNGVIGNFGVCTITSTTGVGYSSGQIISFAIDADTKTATIRVNNTVNTVIDFSALPTGVFIDPAVWLRTSGDSFIANYGQQPFTYTPPTGFAGLNTFNLPTPTIGATASTQANKYMDVTLWAGNNSTQSITNSGSMQPDCVWIKNRTGGNNHARFDSVRGATLRLYETTLDEQTETTTLTSFNSNGFSLGSAPAVNASSNNYVGWQWRAGGTPAVTNTAGTITSTVSANTSSGFSVVTYSANGSTGTVGHGLGVAPAMIIVKKRNAAERWCVFHTSTSNAYIYLNETFAAETANANLRFGNNTVVVQPTDSVFTIGSSNDVNGTSGTYVAYCFAQVAGYSAFGSYVGNNSNDGTFIYTGFRPVFVLYKKANGTDGWAIYDAKRNSYNVADALLQPDNNGAEAITAPGSIDILSNGFKQRNSNNFGNSSSFTYIYAAFAEYPFKYANAR